MELSDEVLIAHYREDGDEASLALLVERYVPLVYSFVYRLCRNKAEAEDIVQEVFVRAWKNLGKYRLGSSFKSWLLTIAHNRTIDYLRKKRELTFSDFDTSTGENVLVDTLADAALLADEAAVRAADREVLEAALSQLASNYREVLLLRYEDDLTFEEIGKVLKKPLHTVKSQHRRALIKLRELLAAPNNTATSL